jgi:hypothetical protein
MKKQETRIEEQLSVVSDNFCKERGFEIIVNSYWDGRYSVIPTKENYNKDDIKIAQIAANNMGIYFTEDGYINEFDIEKYTNAYLDSFSMFNYTSPSLIEHVVMAGDPAIPDDSIITFKTAAYAKKQNESFYNQIPAAKWSTMPKYSKKAIKEAFENKKDGSNALTLDEDSVNQRNANFQNIKIQNTGDIIVEQVKQKLTDRSAVGQKKYGTTIFDNIDENYIKHLQDELLDGANYCEQVLRLGEFLKKIIEILDKKYDHITTGKKIYDEYLNLNLKR